jgi:hypothetical protein
MCAFTYEKGVYFIRAYQKNMWFFYYLKSNIDIMLFTHSWLCWNKMWIKQHCTYRKYDWCSLAIISWPTRADCHPDSLEPIVDASCATMRWQRQSMVNSNPYSIPSLIETVLLTHRLEVLRSYVVKRRSVRGRNYSTSNGLRGWMWKGLGRIQ